MQNKNYPTKTNHVIKRNQTPKKIHQKNAQRIPQRDILHQKFISLKKTSSPKNTGKKICLKNPFKILNDEKNWREKKF